MPLRLSGLAPGGLRTLVTDSWELLEFELTNHAGHDRQARVFVFHEGRSDVQYGRDVWVPAGSTLISSLLIGPREVPTPTESLEVQFLLYERTQGEERLVLPRGEERIRSRKLPYRPREVFTTIVLDDETVGLVWGKLPQPPSRTDEAFTLARACRRAADHSEDVRTVASDSLPATPLGFDGIDQFVLASERIARDHAGLQALRQWLERGGRMWVMLDVVDPEILVPLLGDALDFHIVDRVRLATFQIDTRPSGAIPSPEVHEHDRPVDFARVLLPSDERVDYSIDGWPVCFVRPLGRGKIVFTTLGMRGLRVAKTRAARAFPDGGPGAFPGGQASSAPGPAAALVRVADELETMPNERTFNVGAFRPLLSEDIGYAVISRGSLMLVFASFLGGAIVVGVILRRSRRPELVGWMGPAAALGAAGMVLALAQSANRAVTPTTTVAQIVHPAPGTNEAAVHGLLAVSRPYSGTDEIGAPQGGYFELDMSGIEGRTRRLIVDGLNGWHWDNLALPAGVRFATFSATVPGQAPIAAVARFGARGLEGKLTAGPFEDWADAVLWSRDGRSMTLQLSADGAFRAGQEDVLPRGQFLAGTVLSDRQQRRQEIYREFLKFAAAEPTMSGNILLAWAKPADMHFTLGQGARLSGSALLVLPLRMEHAARGEPVRIPGPLVSCRKVFIGSETTALAREGDADADMALRFQVPATVLPLKIRSARLLGKFSAPGRRLVVTAPTDAGAVELYRADSPADAFHIDISDPRFLRLDQDGKLHLNLSLRGSGQKAKSARDPIQEAKSVRDSNRLQNWKMEYLELEIAGQTE